MLLTWDRTCSWDNIRVCMWERLDCELPGEWYNRGLCVWIWVSILLIILSDPVCTWAEPHLCLCASGSRCLPSLPETVRPVGSSQPAGWAALRAGSSAPQVVLFPAPASLSPLDSAPATWRHNEFCIISQILTTNCCNFFVDCALEEMT